MGLCDDRTAKSCPCRYTHRSGVYCNLPEYIVNLFDGTRDKNSEEYKTFLKQVCKRERQLLQGMDLHSKETHYRLAKAVNQMESGEIKPGDIVYCSKEGDPVLFLEYPEQVHFETYHRLGVFPCGDAKYQALDGEIRYAPVACFTKISKGNYFSTHKISNEEDNSREGFDRFKRHERLRGQAMAEGLRVETKRTLEGYELTFYGDSQQAVDDFVELCCRQDFRLY